MPRSCTVSGTRPKKSTSIASAAPTSATMRAIRKNTSSPCGQHDLSCLAVVDDAPRPYALSCEVLIRTTSSSYNPDDAVNFNLAGTKFVPGFDVAGVVEDLGPITPAGFQKGDRVWGMFLNGGQAEYVARPPFTVGLLPPAPGGDGADPINMSMVGTLPTVGLTMMGALRQAGAPWKQQDNITLILTAGNGGTGFVTFSKILRGIVCLEMVVLIVGIVSSGTWGCNLPRHWVLLTLQLRQLGTALLLQNPLELTQLLTTWYVYAAFIQNEFDAGVSTSNIIFSSFPPCRTSQCLIYLAFNQLLMSLSKTTTTKPRPVVQ